MVRKRTMPGAVHGSNGTLGADGPEGIANAIIAEIRALPVQNTPNTRALRRKYSAILRQKNPESIFDVARELLNAGIAGSRTS